MILRPVHTISRIRLETDRYPAEGLRLGFVPTMGALHRGHEALIRRAGLECDRVAVSVFVNPLQFSPEEDLRGYPRNLEKDLQVCASLGVDLVFAPSPEEMYPAPQLAYVDVDSLTEHLCGPFRPGHFRGVATVVLKLLNIIRPARAYFGEKDYQQLVVIRKMISDLNLTVEIVPVATVRESDGLACSSRNAYLDPERRSKAPLLYRALEAARDEIVAGLKDPVAAREAGLKTLAGEAEIEVEYLQIVDIASLQPVNRVTRPVLIAGAVRIGSTRLIDNIVHP
ncbi:MAG TPA: pantoate--beta-alanine ligase [Acidobacteriota bacterium]|nr:pantoate--beta-alanine ligase [Acidobacteriota bacterium]